MITVDKLFRYVVKLSNGLSWSFVMMENNSCSYFESETTESVYSTMDRGLIKLQPLFIKELQLAVIATWHDIPCRSLRLAAKRGVDSLCFTFLMPFNAFWTGLGFTLLLFIPAIIFAVKLAGLYRKTEKYSRDYEEPDYISYHGFYMRPPTDYQDNPQKPRNKSRKHKGYVAVPNPGA
ncbi:unnamed protein product [Heterobilharzia americana]|nr:unnamed protein product [Heterobilharzia americana]